MVSEEKKAILREYARKNKIYLNKLKRYTYQADPDYRQASKERAKIYTCKRRDYLKGFKILPFCYEDMVKY